MKKFDIKLYFITLALFDICLPRLFSLIATALLPVIVVINIILIIPFICYGYKRGGEKVLYIIFAYFLLKFVLGMVLMKLGSTPGIPGEPSAFDTIFGLIFIFVVSGDPVLMLSTIYPPTIVILSIPLLLFLVIMIIINKISKQSKKRHAESEPDDTDERWLL
jgi:hypothetical protein